jgi:hypothetical protein
MKIILILYMCSMNTGGCLPPYQWPIEFEDAYECSVAGYEEAARKLKEIGREEVNKHQISITFSCKKIATT